jgi:succinate dehydrogenase/fumarate reductase flavoprotein subunit
MISFYYSPLELVLLIMSMAFCVFFGVILGYKLTKYESKKENSIYPPEVKAVVVKKKRFLPLLKKGEKKKEADDGIRLPKNMEW